MKTDNDTLKARAASLERLHDLLPHRAEPLFELIKMVKELENPEKIAASEAKLDAWRAEHGTKSDEWLDTAVLWNMTHWEPLITLAVDFEMMGHVDIADELCHLAQLYGIPAEHMNIKRGDFLAERGQMKRALVYWRRAFELNSENIQALGNLLEYFTWEEDLPARIEFLERIYQMEGYEDVIGTHLAAAYTEAERFDDVERILPTLGLDQAEADDFAAEISVLRAIAEGRGDDPVGQA